MSTMTQAMSARFFAMLAFGFLLAGAVCVPAEVLANPGRGMIREGRAEHGGAMRDFAAHALQGLLRHQTDLGLSEEQSAMIKAIAGDYAKTRIRGEADFKLAEVDVRTLVRDEKADLSTIEAALKKSEGAHTALRLEGVKALRTATAVLTPEQREKWGASMKERHHMGGHRDGTRAEKRSAEE